MRVGFYILGEKGFVVLRDFIEKYSTGCISFVVIGRDSNVENDYFLESKELCKKYGIAFFERGMGKEILLEKAGITFVVGWRWLIHSANNLVVLHDSILPRYRGFSPLVNMLINGEREIGVTAIAVSEGYDEGDILAQKIISVEYPLKIQEAIELITPLYSELVLDVYDVYCSTKRFVGEKQDHNSATYSLWRAEGDYIVDWELSSESIKRFCDSVGPPYSGASSYLGGAKVYIHDIEVVNDVVVEGRAQHVGKIIFMVGGAPVVVCGSGLVKIVSATFGDGRSLRDNINFRSRFLPTIEMVNNDPV